MHELRRKCSRKDNQQSKPTVDPKNKIVILFSGLNGDFTGQRVRQQTVSQQPRDLITYQMPDPSNKKENAMKTEMKRFSSITSYLQNPPCQAELTLRNNFFPNCCVALNMPRKF
ncbi:Uncharacterized protein APZ42_019466 [Daphnia magna]|uniref:Uncharacterized protein n=1 Tax=Daphnia magna TaxID=35525 RepID=A0A164Y6S8_9CRUS|nr:Uncharacterized protein APZ42_019466 [Daphnia magna]